MCSASSGKGPNPLAVGAAATATLPRFPLIHPPKVRARGIVPLPSVILSLSPPDSALYLYHRKPQVLPLNCRCFFFL